MKLKNEFASVYQNDGSITVSTNTDIFSGMIKGNKTAAIIMRCLEKETSLEDIVNVICSKYDVEPSIVETDVKDLLNKLRSIDALDE